MREQIRQFIQELSRKEQAEVVHAIVAELAQDVKEESAFINADGVVVGYYVPIEKWLNDHPCSFCCSYKNAEEAYEAAKNGRSLSEVVASFNATHPADPESSTNELIR